MSVFLSMSSLICLDLYEKIGIGIADDSKLFTNRPINPSFKRIGQPGLFMNVILPTVIVSWFKKEPSVIIVTYNTGTQSKQYTKTSR